MKRRNGLESNARTVAIAVLNARVADTIDLSLAAKQAHWNLRGGAFLAVHEMLGRLRTNLDGYVDTMAERAVALGGVALGTTQTTAKTTTLAPYPTTTHSVGDHLAAMADRVGALGNSIRGNIGEATAAGDAGTADLFTGVSRDLDKWLWFIEAQGAG